MSVPAWLEKTFITIVDGYFSLLPQTLPGKTSLEACRIVAHRGEHDNIKIIENTIPAFELAIKNKIWGIEFDIRWTKDLHPVVFHDADLKRIFNKNLMISQLSLGELRQNFPEIPILEDIIEKFGKKAHFMVEIKEELYPRPAMQNKKLQDLFSPLEPGKDYHIMSLSDKMLKTINFIPSSFFLPIAEMNMTRLSDLAVEENYNGVTGHYLFLTESIIEKHHNRGQKIGTGFIASRNCLFREINRKVDWIFSNKGAFLQSIIEDSLKNSFY